MRLFIAAEITEEIRKKAEEIIKKLEATGADVKFTEPENLHITLKFLGEVADEHVKEVEEDISRALDGFKQFRISVECVGYFGNPKHIKTLWIDAREGCEELVKLAQSMNIALDHMRREEREPKPHITIGRARSGRNRDSLLREIESFKHVKLGEMDVKLVSLKQSVLSKEGPHYTDLKVFELV